MIINLGDAPFKAFIKVTYKNGTCTCTNGKKTYTHSGGGTATFEVNAKGTWTVKATYSSYTSSQDVSVEKRGEAKNITLNYTQILYDNGNLYAGVTGGWEVFGGASTSGERDGKKHLYASQDFNYTGHYTKTTLDLSPFSTLCATFTAKSGGTSVLQIVNSSATGDGVQGNGVYDNAIISTSLGSGAGTVRLSLGTVKSGKVRLCLRPSAYYWASKVWLE